MSPILVSVLEILWFFLPGFAANMAPVFATRYRWVPRLAIPLDARYTLGNIRILGNNKTLRGVVVGLVAGVIVGAAQYMVVQIFQIGETTIFTYPSLLISMAIGYWLALGALLGDVLKSFLKRRITIPSGESWIPWDQIDIVIGMFLITAWSFKFSLWHVVSAFVFVGVGMFGVSTIGVKTRIKKSL